MDVNKTASASKSYSSKKKGGSLVVVNLRSDTTESEVKELDSSGDLVYNLVGGNDILEFLQ